jgi:hypothetical protein
MYVGLNNLGLNYVSKTFSPASVFNVDSTGLWVEAYDPNYLLQRRNILTYSEDMTNAAWGKVLSVTAPTANTVVFPQSVNGERIEQTPGTPAVAGETWTFSLELSGTAGETINVAIDGNDGLGGSNEQTITLSATPTVVELTHTYTAGVGAATLIRCMVVWRTGNTAATVTVDKMQVNNASSRGTYQKVTDWYTQYIEAALDSIAAWQDATASTPVTAVGQTLGMIYDKSDNLEFDAPLVTLTGTSSGSWTTSNASIANDGGALKLTCTVAGTFQATYTIATTAGSMYRIVADINRGTAANAANIGFAFIGSTFTNSTESTEVTVLLPAPGATLDIQIYGLSGSIGETLFFNNIVVQRMQGSYLAQSTSGSRPVVSSRVNLLTQTEDMSGADWTLGGTATVTGTDVLNVPATDDYITQAIGDATTGTEYFASVVVSGTGTITLVRASFGGDYQITLTSTPTRYTISGVATVPAIGVYLYKRAGDTATQVTATEFQLQAVEYTQYQRVNTATDYDTTGFPAMWQFDGTDDALITATFSAGTLSADMDCFILMRRFDDSRSILGDSGPADYFFCYDADNVIDVAGSNVGVPTYYMNGTQVPANGGSGQTMRDDLAAAIPIGEWVVAEAHNLDLSAFTAYNFSNYGATWYFSGDTAAILICSAQTDAVRAQIRRYLGNKVGLTL